MNRSIVGSRINECFENDGNGSEPVMVTDQYEGTVVQYSGSFSDENKYSLMKIENSRKAISF